MMTYHILIDRQVVPDLGRDTGTLIVNPDGSRDVSFNFPCASVMSFKVIFNNVIHRDFALSIK